MCFNNIRRQGIEDLTRINQSVCQDIEVIFVLEESR
jgi:hypothetical protein